MPPGVRFPTKVGMFSKISLMVKSNPSQQDFEK